MVLQYVIMTKDIKEEELEEILKNAGGDIMPSLAQRWMDQGKEQGMQQGMQQGLQQGMQQGLQQGVQQGLQQGIREMVLDALETKFGRSSAHIKEQISQLTDRDKLKELHKIILKVQDIKELESSHIWN